MDILHKSFVTENEINFKFSVKVKRGNAKSWELLTEWLRTP